MIDARELEEAEWLIWSIDRNEFHPANDRTHKNHRQSAKVLRLLKVKVAENRAKLDAEMVFKNGT